MDINIQDCIKQAQAELIQGNDKETLSEISIDTRSIKSGETFIAIGIGNDYIKEALKKGAKIIVAEVEVEKELLEKYPETSILKVKDSVKFMQQMASFKRQQYNIPVIAITGSVGKTSTKDIVANVIAQKYKVLKTEGNFNNHIGLPLTILKLKEHTALVIEMGMNHFGEIKILSEIAKPNIAVITNIGTSHIGILGSRENILKAKLEILEGLQEDGKLILNQDNDLLKKWYKDNQRPHIITYGIEENSQYMAKEIKISEEGSQYNILLKEKQYQVEVPVSGTHFIYNSLCAIAVGMTLKMEPEAILKGIKEFTLSKKRMEIEKIENVTIINDAYNASYESMKYGLEYLKNVKGKRKIAVLGDMLELGEFTKELHSKVGEEVIKHKIDILLTVGQQAKQIAKEAKSLGMENIYILDTNEQAINTLKQIEKKEDVILLKASNGMKFFQILEGLKEFYKTNS